MEENQEYITTDEAVAELIFSTNYTVDHFYKYHSFQGGLTKKQFDFLYDAYQSKLAREYEFQAALHGTSLKGGKKQRKKEPQSDNTKVPLFSDPEEYTNISPEEREKMTQAMLGKHRSWAANPLTKSI